MPMYDPFANGQCIDSSEVLITLETALRAARRMHDFSFGYGTSTPETEMLCAIDDVLLRQLAARNGGQAQHSQSDPRHAKNQDNR